MVEVGGQVGVDDLGHRAAEAHKVAVRNAAHHVVAVENPGVHEAAQHVDVLVQHYAGQRVLQGQVVEVRHLCTADNLEDAAAENYRIRAAHERAVVNPVAAHDDVVHQRHGRKCVNRNVEERAVAEAAHAVVHAATKHHAVGQRSPGAIHHQIVEENGVEAQVHDCAAVHVHVVEARHLRTADDLRTARAVEIDVVAAATHVAAVVRPVVADVQSIVHGEGRAVANHHIAHVERLAAVEELGNPAHEAPGAAAAGGYVHTVHRHVAVEVKRTVVGEERAVLDGDVQRQSGRCTRDDGVERERAGNDDDTRGAGHLPAAPVQGVEPVGVAVTARPGVGNGAHREVGAVVGAAHQARR